MLTFRFTGADGCMVENETLTSGMVGKKVKLEFSSEWSNLRKTVVFMAGSVTRDVVEVTDEIEIPAEVLAVPQKQLYVGVYGVSNDGMVTPTIRALGPMIEPGADPSGDEATNPELPVWAQLLASIGDLSKLTTEARDNLVAAINEAAKTGSGGNVYILTEGETIEDAPADADIVIDPFGEADEESSTPGEDGGYYTPSVTQPDANTAQFAFTPSKEGMTEVAPVSVTLPAGPQGEKGETGADGAQGPQGEPGKDGVIALTGAAIGQIAKITAVDENGVPTAWEPVDMPSGGGEKAWRLIRSVTLSEDAESFEITTDSDGNAFELSEFSFYIMGKSLGATANIGLKINDVLAYYSSNLGSTNTTATLESNAYGLFTGNSWRIIYKAYFNAAGTIATSNAGRAAISGKMTKFWYGKTNSVEGAGFQAGTILELWGR